MQKSVPTSGSIATRPVRGRGRPRAFDREAALAQATRLFWLKGYEATSIADLTEAMGIGSPSLYAAYGSKEALYTEALQHYNETYEALVWGGFRSAGTAREAVLSYLMDSAAALTGSLADNPLGCMVTLAAVGGECRSELGIVMRSARAVTLERLEACLSKAVSEGELAGTTDTHALARFVQTVQSGMSILARDGVTRAELEGVAQVAMLRWDACT
ncbi:MAG: TetR/AcrR family transcriptional regulator [Methylobacterium sp.]|uniref:TetR/AcrR family transcriptional regulator n=1 Tax=Methylobacterium sp. TaxID=409 RepID=UPI0025F96681|nr:TetR/AcrR family transcriptional regulator [Methylobacterium sp.]MBX9933027.1 TetR/AcrR family transcriptional regulator [Methylobacterium sp.]